MNKVNVRRIKEYLYVIIFLLIVLGLGFQSYKRLVKFYVDQEIDYNEWAPELGTKFETDIASTFYNKFGFVNLNGAISAAMKQPSMNGIYKLKNGHLIIPQEKMTVEEIEPYAEEVVRYAIFCNSQGAPFLFVQPILKVDPDNKQLPAGVEDYSNENIDTFLGILKDAGIEILDIRECMKNDGMDIYDYTYITDHHWTTEGCFYAFVKISEWIDAKTGITTNPKITDINQYDIVKYDKWHLGSYGQRTGKYYAGIDDYDLLLPHYDMSFLDSEGNEHSFFDLVVNRSVFKNRDITSRYTYDSAIVEPQGISNISHKCTVMFITDSYVTAMEPYLKVAYSDYLYQFYENGFNMDDIIQSLPDVVILMPYYTSAFSNKAVCY